MAFSGETMPFVEFIAFDNKAELYGKLSDMKKKSAGLPEPDKTIVGEMTAAAIQEIVDCDERELMSFKQYLSQRGKRKAAS